VYNNLGNIQDINNDNLLEQAQSWFENDIECVEFEYVSRSIFERSPEEDSVHTDRQIKEEAIERASLNWRLTSREKRNIERNFYSEHNQNSLLRLNQLLEP
jgi:viroplasmin and RNaseH domain-containing protein